MINNQELEEIKTFLDLEQIMAFETLTILCLPKYKNPDFEEKCNVIKSLLKQRLETSQIIFKIIEKGEIENVESIEFCG